MELVIGCDHAAFKEKAKLIENLGRAHQITDVGTTSSSRVDYPLFAKKVCELVKNSEKKGILICGSGIGMSMAANRYKGIRAALCRSQEDAHLSRAHNDSNVLCLGARINSVKEMEEIIRKIILM